MHHLDEFDRTAVVTIQGGGVYGLTLLGQANALVKSGLRPLAIAGTSTGAIIATLLWVGWHPEDVRDRLRVMAQDNKLRSLVGTSSHRAHDFDLKSWRSLVKDGKTLSHAAIHIGNETAGMVDRFCSTIHTLFSSKSYFKRISPHIEARGFFNGDTLEKFIDDMIREKLNERISSCISGTYKLPEDRLLTFRDVSSLMDKAFPKIYFPPLMLAATNVGTLNVELFNSYSDRYQNVPIARAVRASAGFPVFFMPVEVEGLQQPSWFIDGGVISNFPAWAYSEQFRREMEKNKTYKPLAFRPWVHVGLRLINEDILDKKNGETLPVYSNKALEDPSVYGQALIQLLTGQARNRLEDLISKKIARSAIIAQPIEESGGPSNVLDIEKLNDRRVALMFKKGNDYAESSLGKLGFSIPETSPGNDIPELLDGLTQKVSAIFGVKDADSVIIRANIFLPKEEKLVLTYRTNMVDASGTHHPDYDMVFDSPTQGLTGSCFSMRRPMLCNLRGLANYFKKNGEALHNLSVEQQTKILPSQTWLASTPIFDPDDLIFRRSLNEKEVFLSDALSAALQSTNDGPVFGVLNLDASFDYAHLNLSDKAHDQVNDARVQATFDTMFASALKIGKIFSNHFATTES